MPDDLGKAGAQGKKLETWVPVIVGAGQLLVAFVELTRGQLEAFGLLAVAVLPWVAVIVLRKWSPLKYVFALALSVALTVPAFIVGWGATQPAASAEPLGFLPHPGLVSHCDGFQGTGDIPSGDQLVLFERPSDPQGGYTERPVFFDDGPVRPGPGGKGWIASNREIGSGNNDAYSYLTIVALLVPKGTEDFLNDITQGSPASGAPANDSGAVPASVMNLGIQKARMVVQRNNQNANCPH